MKTYLREYSKKKVFLNKTKFLGIVSGILLNLSNKKLEGLTIKKDFLSYDYFLFDEITEINEEIIIGKKLKIDNPNYYEILSKVVYNQDGKYLGDVFDVGFDDFFNFKNIYVRSGFFFSAKIKTKLIKNNIKKYGINNILEIGENYIIVNDVSFMSENKKTLENISKIFINIPKPSYNINCKNNDKKMTIKNT